MEKKEKSEYLDEQEIKPRKWLMSILIIIMLVIIVILANKVIIDRQKNANKCGIICTIKKHILNDGFDLRSYNSKFEFYSGTESGMAVNSLIDYIVTNNKTNKDKLIKVIFKDINTNDVVQIANIKQSISRMKSYEVSIDYNEDGYVNMITIEQAVSKEKAQWFNSSFEMRAGEQNKFFINYLLDDVITNNKKNEDIISVVYNDIDTTEEEQINEIRNQLDDSTNYNVSFDYNEYGYINRVTIK